MAKAKTPVTTKPVAKVAKPRIDRLTKTELIKIVKNSLGEGVLSEKMVHNVIDGIFVTISDALENGTEVTLPGVGILKPSVSAARDGRNPITGTPVKIEAKKVVRFKSSLTLKNKINS